MVWHIALHYLLHSYTSTKKQDIHSIPFTLSYIYTGGDFNSSVCVVKFSVGQIRSSVCIPIHDDTVKEGNEMFYVLLSVPNTSGLVSGHRTMARIIIYG